MKALLPFLALLFFAGCKKNDAASDGSSSTLHQRQVGASANELLNSAKYKSLKIEIQYMPGYAPDAAAVNHLQNFLSTHLNKPSGISITTKEIAASAETVLTAEKVQALEKANRSAFFEGDAMAVYVLYTNGTYSDNNVLGIAYRNTSCAVFGKTIHNNSGGFNQTSRTKLEATVLEHELSHLLGLVDIGSPMQTSHKSNGNHCNNQNCLMYYASETTDVLGVLLTGNIPALDANCVNDLKANGGKQ